MTRNLAVVLPLLSSVTIKFRKTDGDRVDETFEARKKKDEPFVKLCLSLTFQKVSSVKPRNVRFHTIK